MQTGQRWGSGGKRCWNGGFVYAEGNLLCLGRILALSLVSFTGRKHEHSPPPQHKLC